MQYDDGIGISDGSLLQSTESSIATSFSSYPSVIIDLHTESRFIITQTESSKSFRQRNCTKAAILEFPSDGLTKCQRQHGWILVHLVLACYCFWLLAVVCDDYFVPAIDIICSCKYMNIYLYGKSFLPESCCVLGVM